LGVSFPDGVTRKGDEMDKAWIKIISITGAVGVVGLLFSILMNNMFNSEIVTLLGSEKLFYILILLICGFTMALIIAIMKPKGETQSVGQSKSSELSKQIDVTYDNGSTHNGDNKF